MDTKDLINHLTEDIIKLYDIKIPIKDIDAIVEKLGGKVVNTPELHHKMENCYVKKHKDAFVILVDDRVKNSPNRTMLIARELGYLFLFMGYQTNRKLWNESTDDTVYKRNYAFRTEDVKKEWMAYDFALALMMPEDEYRKIANQYSEGNQIKTRKIAEYFHVNLTAAYHRGKKLGTIQSVI